MAIEHLPPKCTPQHLFKSAIALKVSFFSREHNVSVHCSLDFHCWCTKFLHILKMELISNCVGVWLLCMWASMHNTLLCGANFCSLKHRNLENISRSSNQPKRCLKWTKRVVYLVNLTISLTVEKAKTVVRKKPSSKTPSWLGFWNHSLEANWQKL